MGSPDHPRRFSVEYDARLVEEAILERITGHPEEDRFRRTRNRIYQLEDVEEREERFRELHAHWFSRLYLGRPVTASLGEQPILVRETRRCCVLPAISSHDEGADLHELRESPSHAAKAERAILVKLKPNRFLDPSSLQALLRHELMHIADMLDPRFGYQPVLPKSEAGSAYDHLVRDRYRVLWNTWIDGRLSRRGWAPEGIREKRLAECAATFSVSAEQARKKFQELFDSDSQTHTRLMALALNPGPRFRSSQLGKPRARPCPLCRLPSFDLIRDASHLPAEALQELAADFPDWRPGHGLCRQCADLYQTRNLSRLAEAALPKI